MKNFMKMRLPLTGILGALLMAGLVSCDNEAEEVSQENDIENEVTSTGIQADGEMEMESVFEVVEDEMAIISEGLEGGRIATREHRILPDCATVSHDEESSTVTIDFGSENCLGKDGLYRRGSIVVTYSGRRNEPGAYRTVTLSDYYVNDNLLTGTKTYTNVTEESGEPTVNVVVTDATFTNDRGTVSWSSNRTITMIDGKDTPRNPFDDMYSITGSSTGVNRRGIAHSLTITEPLIRNVERGCARTFIDGLVAYENENGLAWTLDYDPIGGQPCDRVGAITIGEETYQITLR